MKFNTNAAVFLGLLVTNFALIAMDPTSTISMLIFSVVVISYIVGLVSNLHPLIQGVGRGAAWSALLFGSCLVSLLFFKSEGVIPFAFCAALCFAGFVSNLQPRLR